MSRLFQVEAVTGRLPDRYEVVNDEVVELPDSSALASEVANRLNEELQVFGQASRLGISRMEMLFHLPLPYDESRKRKLDVAFIASEHWSAKQPIKYRSEWLELVPELAVEVTSPTDRIEDVFSRTQELVLAGVRLVWLVMPKLRVIYAFSPESPSRPQVFTATDTLTGGDVLPGFEVPMAPLFPTIVD